MTSAQPHLPHPAQASTLLSGLDFQAFSQTLQNARQRLLDERNEHGWWTGELSSSALSTATAIVAMTLARLNGSPVAQDVEPLVSQAMQWLITNQNQDGGWGDTDKSKSNISTTMLVWAAMGLVTHATGDKQAQAIERCEAWLANHAGSLEVPALVDAVMKRYGKDRTFSVPILTMCALCGRLGPVKDRKTWRWVKQLPFEFAAFPRAWFKLLNLQVVSYALPALIAIGHVRHHHRPTRNPIARAARWMTKKRTLKLLERIQPSSGGFLEATPLTSFVSMSLAACGFASHPVVTRAIAFIKQSVRPDGSWPIDTNLATWVTTLSINALAAGGKLQEHLNENERTVIRDWILKQQYKEVHPYTGAAPGGWAWTDLPGGVPDADDTSGAVIALVNLEKPSLNAASLLAAVHGSLWLSGSSNRDGGMPTFCRGWGKLPFDRSSTDITAHARRALYASYLAFLCHDKSELYMELGSPFELMTLVKKFDTFLCRNQRKSGAWEPLWFGCQDAVDEMNLTYGTTRVVSSLWNYFDKSGSRQKMTHAIGWLVNAQNIDHGWGGAPGTPSTIEDTSGAVEALATVVSLNQDAGDTPLVGTTPSELNASMHRGIHWLIEHTQRGTSFPPSPIGFYFAKLWYYEKLYPIIYTVAALERVAALIERESNPTMPQEHTT